LSPTAHSSQYTLTFATMRQTFGPCAGRFMTAPARRGTAAEWRWSCGVPRTKRSLFQAMPATNTVRIYPTRSFRSWPRITVGIPERSPKRFLCPPTIRRADSFTPAVQITPTITPLQKPRAAHIGAGWDSCVQLSTGDRKQLSDPEHVHLYWDANRNDVGLGCSGTQCALAPCRR
jgi:hypothetical protein